MYTWVGLFFDAVVPQLGWSGDISKTYMLAKDSSQDTGKVGASVVGQKIFTMTFTIVALTLGLGFLLFRPIRPPLPLIDTLLIAIVLALSILSLIIVYFVSVKPTATKTLLNWTIRRVLFLRRKWNPENFRIKAEEFLTKFHVGIKQLGANPKCLIKPIIYSFVSFSLEVSVIFFAFVALGYPIPVDKVLIVFTLTGTLQAVGITMFGFAEIVMTSVFAFLGLPVDLSFSVTLLTRVVTLWFRLIISYVALQWAGIEIMTKKQNSNPA